MEMVQIMITLQLTLFSLMLVGMLARKINLVDPKGRKMLTDLLINIILPCNIFRSFVGSGAVSADFASTAIILLILGTVTQVLAIYGSKLLFIKYPKAQKAVLSYGMICSNSGFIGHPVAEALFGAVGVMYTSVYQTPLRFTMWTAGVALFTEGSSAKDAFKKLAKHPCIIAVFLGIPAMLLQIPLPAFLNDTIISISKCTSPISMIVIGSILAEVPIKSLCSKTVFYFTALRLILFPALMYAVMLPFGLDQMTVGIVLLMTGMPGGTTTSILADKYGGDAVLASKIVFVSTLCSIVTIPLLTLFI